MRDTTLDRPFFLVGGFVSSHRKITEQHVSVVKFTRDSRASLSDVRLEYTQNYGKYFAYARLITPSRVQAEDFVQQAFVNTVNTIKNGNEVLVETLGAYLMSAIRNISISTHRRESVQPTLRVIEGVQETPDAFHQLSDQRKVVAGAISKLSTTQRAITVMYYFDSMNVREIAQELNVSESAVRTHLQRARQNLARTLGDDESFRKDA
jgi:RNA polymerase sigma-70 factor (ECF subfamily)